MPNHSGPCPICGQSMELTAAGTMPPHDGIHFGELNGVPCSGAGMPPSRMGEAGNFSATTMAQDSVRLPSGPIDIGDRVVVDLYGNRVEGEVIYIDPTKIQLQTDEQKARNSAGLLTIPAASWEKVQKLAAKVAGAATMARTSGYVYELEEGANWQSAPDDAWETVVEDVDGRVVGRRRVDGATVVVIEMGGKYYAVLPQNVQMNASGLARTMAFRSRLLMPGDRLTIDGGAKVGQRIDEHEPTPGDFETGVTVHFTDGTTREWGGFDPFWQKNDHAGTFARGGAQALGRVKARFVSDSAQFKHGEIVYVESSDLRNGGRDDEGRLRRVWISEDPDGSRGAYGFASDVELLSAMTMAVDCQGAELREGDRVSIDKVGAGIVASVSGDSVRIRVPGATPEEESFSPREVQFWRVTRLSRTSATALATSYVPGDRAALKPGDLVRGERGYGNVLEVQEDGRARVRWRNGTTTISPPWLLEKVVVGGGRPGRTMSEMGTDSGPPCSRCGMTLWHYDVSEATGTVRARCASCHAERTFEAHGADTVQAVKEAQAQQRAFGRPGRGVAIWNGRRGHLVRRYSVQGEAWLLVEVRPGHSLSWPAREARTTTFGRNDVTPEDACPRCGERDADHLVWDEDGEKVTCSTCGKTYVPGTGLSRGGATTMAAEYDGDGGRCLRCGMAKDLHASVPSTGRLLCPTGGSSTSGTTTMAGSPTDSVNVWGYDSATGWDLLLRSVTRETAERMRAHFTADGTVVEITKVGEAPTGRPAQLASTMSFLSDGDRVRANSDLKQIGWAAVVKRGTTGTVVGVDPGAFGVVAYRVRWDDGQTNTLVNAHLLVSRETSGATAATTMAIDKAASISLPTGFSWMNGGDQMSFPVEPGRYSVTSIDRSQSPSVESHGTFSSITAALRFADTLIPDKADVAQVWDGKRGFMVARGVA